MSEVSIIIFITLVGPVVGSFLGVFKRYSKKQVDYLLSFAAGVMVSVSIFELLPESYKNTSLSFLVVGLLMGIILMHILNKILPHFHHSSCSENKQLKTAERSAFFIFLGISIHNLPEGLAIGFGSLANFNFSLIIALAIALHDIPEAICVAAPYYFATKKRMKSFIITLLTVIPTVLGFLLAYYFLNDISHQWLGVFTSFTAGVMIYISFFEIIPGIINKKSSEKISTFFSFFVGVVLVFVLHVFFGI